MGESVLQGWGMGVGREGDCQKKGLQTDRHRQTVLWE